MSATTSRWRLRGSSGTPVPERPDEAPMVADARAGERALAGQRALVDEQLDGRARAVDARDGQRRREQARTRGADRVDVLAGTRGGRDIGRDPRLEPATGQDLERRDEPVLRCRPPRARGPASRCRRRRPRVSAGAVADRARAEARRRRAPARPPGTARRAPRRGRPAGRSGRRTGPSPRTRSAPARCGVAIRLGILLAPLGDDLGLERAGRAIPEPLVLVVEDEPVADRPRRARPSCPGTARGCAPRSAGCAPGT